MEVRAVVVECAWGGAQNNGIGFLPVGGRGVNTSILSTHTAQDDAPPASAGPASASGTAPTPDASSMPPPAPASPPEELAEEDEAAVARRAALAEKEAGNAAYKARDFDKAIARYSRAIELDDADVSFLCNRAAAHFEQGGYDACVADCDAAVERGREVRADYKLMARALARKGNALVKKGELEEAVAVYQKSLTEHRCL